MNSALEKQAIDVLASRIINDYKLTDSELARRLGERVAQIIEEGGFSFSTATQPTPEDSKKAFSRVRLDSTIVDSFKSEAINSAISIIEARATEICSWPAEMTLMLGIGERGYYDGSSDMKVFVEIHYPDVHAKMRKISEWLCDLSGANISSLIGKQITRASNLAKMAGKLEGGQAV